jgi:ornithine cyclodeaminase/alanine dehydrogenase-like protein (mu-crystallin family)
LLFLTEKDVEQALSMKEGIDICEEAYKNYSDGRISHFFQAGDPLTDDGGAYIILPASDRKKKIFGFKYAGSYPSNPSKGIPTVACTIQLCDLDNGFPVCLMGANLLTSVKTASSQAVATKYMSRENSSVMAIVGAGHQARFQLEAVSYVRKLRELRIADIDKSRAENLAKWYLENIDRDVKVTVSADPDQASRGADIVTTITTSFKPVISAKSVSAGAHLNAMGSFTPDMQEIDCDIVQAAARISTDVASTTWQVAGDLIKPLEKGLIDKNAVTAEMGDIVAGKARGRNGDDEITVFESVGFSVLDIAIATGVYEAAKAKKIGADIEIFGNKTGY